LLVQNANVQIQPGVQDSNAARAEVATNYWRHCKKIWIVARISRAVDDKTSQDILEDQRRRQIDVDCISNSDITFICTRIDEINVNEFPMEVRGDGWQALDQLRAKLTDSQTEQQSLEAERQDNHLQLDNCKDNLIDWKIRRLEISEGR